MEHSLQSKSVQRKIIYFACIIVLLTATIVLRGAGSISLGSRLTLSGLQNQSQQLELRDQEFPCVLRGSTRNGGRALLRLADAVADGHRRKERRLLQMELGCDLVREREPHRPTVHVDEHEVRAFEQIAQIAGQVGTPSDRAILVAR